MQRDQKPPLEAMIAKLMLATDFLMEEFSLELATSILPTRDVLDARIAVVERAAEEFGGIATSARVMLKLVRP